MTYSLTIYLFIHHRAARLIEVKALWGGKQNEKGVRGDEETSRRGDGYLFEHTDSGPLRSSPLRLSWLILF